LINGYADPARSIPVQDIEGNEIVTIEGFRGRRQMRFVEPGFKTDVVQCGFRQQAQTPPEAALLNKGPYPKFKVSGNRNCI
jgi:aerobic-type carbon monoxide dehydrogenase small subunit (CoxS/CutS family)